MLIESTKELAMPSPPKQPPKWRQIADRIAAQITDGVFEPGDRLPSVQAQVSAGMGATATVHRAYQALEAEGVVQTTQGSGTTVLGLEEPAPSVQTGAARLERLRRTGRPLAPRETYVNSRASLRSVADSEIAVLLGVDLYDEIVVRSRTFMRDDRATVLALNFVHMRALGPLPELLEERPSAKFRHDLYAERTGRQIVAGPERSAARLASNGELAEFGIEVPVGVPVPVLVLRTVYSDEEGPLEVWEDILRPGMWHGGSA
ncbi:GntR family transcriptional regulator [Streptomyces clavifer]|uniref:GntR family transcriptional regulator n=1 Tax=Streptomyces clavifer TaxID=68188 RepID=UPI003092D153|nr:GntR family transcriptional regulator [Streptomyces clavifer]WRY86398.1 GntR family transcriptional regulator [Streptomyces clavifer]